MLFRLNKISKFFLWGMQTFCFATITIVSTACSDEDFEEGDLEEKKSLNN